MIQENDFSRPLVESPGWLAAHKRNRLASGKNPAYTSWDSLSGVISVGNPVSKKFDSWKHWSLILLNRSSPDEHLS